MNIVFFGSPNFAIPFLQGLINDPDINVQGVVTQPDKPVGRKKEITPPPVKVIAQKNDIPVLQPPKLKGNQDLEKLLIKLKPDFFVVIAYGKMLPDKFLNIPSKGAINVHASLLPKYRGASPVQSAILNNEKYSGISIIHLTKDMDAGDIYYVRKVPIKSDEKVNELKAKLSGVGSLLLPMCLNDIKEGILSPIPQNENQASYCKKIKKEDARIEPEKETAETIYNKFKAFYNWPGIFMNFNNKRLKILEAKPSENNIKINPGKLIEKDNKLLLGTRKNAIIISKLQFEGKKPMKAKDFINGFLKN